MASMVNGVFTAPDTYGKIQGSFDEGSRLAGDDSNNQLQGNAGNDVFYGGGGNDTFILKGSALNNATGLTSGAEADSVIWDFTGAGGRMAGDNDFLNLSGFGAGSTFTFAKYGGTTDLQYYDIYSTTYGETFTVLIKSINGNLLTTGDYNFYG